MKTLSKISACLLALIMMVTTVIPTYAASNTSTQDNVSVTFETLKDSYSADETITATVTLKNENEVAVNNVSLTEIIPDGYTLQLGEGQSANVGTLAAGETKTLNLSFVPPTPTPPPDITEGEYIFMADFEKSDTFQFVNRDTHTIKRIDCEDTDHVGKVVEFKRVDGLTDSRKSFYINYLGVGSDTPYVVYEFDIKLLDGANTDVMLMLKETDTNKWSTPIRIPAGKLIAWSGKGADSTSSIKNYDELATLQDNTWYTITAVADYGSKSLNIYVNGTKVNSGALKINTDANFTKGKITAKDVETMRFHVDGVADSESTVTIDHFLLDNVRVYKGTQPFEGELIKDTKPIVIDESKSILNIEKLDTSTFPEMLKGYISLHTRNGMVYDGRKIGESGITEGTKVKLDTQPIETTEGFMVVAEEICNALRLSYSASGNTVTINGTSANVTEKDGKLWINAKYFFETILGKKVAIDDKAKSDGMMIAGDTEFTFPSADYFTLGDVNNLRSPLQNLNDYLFFDRLSSEELLEKYKDSELEGEHPRILATADDFARIRDEVKTNSYMSTWYQQLIGEADHLINVNKTALIYELRDSVRLHYVAMDLLDRITTLGMAYQLTGEQKYVDRAWAELESVSNFKDWYGIPLDPGEISTAVAIGYDWMYDKLTEEQREMIETAMYDKAYRVVCDAYMNEAVDYNKLNGRLVVSYNQCVIINSCFAVSALAFMDVYPEESSYILSNALKAADIAITEYGPDGAWFEGPGYWNYTTQYVAKLFSSLDNVFGTCFSLDLTEGLSTTANYILGAQSDVSVFNYNDCDELTLYVPELLYLSNKYEDKSIASATLSLTNGRVIGESGKNTDLVLSLLWYDTSVQADEASMPALDSVYKEEGMITFRDRWSTVATAFVGIHGGFNQIVHGQLDAGSFVYDYDGIRWIKELGKTPYDTSVSGKYQTDGGRWKLFRSKAEAHNTIVLANDTTKAGTDQVVKAKATVTDVKSDHKGAITVLDMSAIYAGLGADSAKRGFFFTDNRSSLVVRDEIKLTDAGSTVYSFFLTDAEVTISEDGTYAILTQSGKQMKLEFATTGNGTATLGCGPASRELLGTTSPINVAAGSDIQKYDYEDGTNVRRIYVKLEGASGDVGITVKLSPMDVNATPVTDYNKSISEWAIPTEEIPATPEVQSVVIAGKTISFDEFNNGAFLSLAGTYTTVPEAVVTVDETKYTCQVTNAENVNGGVTTIVVTDKADSYNIATYTIEFVEIPKPKEFDGMDSIQVVNVEASDEPQADRGHHRWCVVDNDNTKR